MANEDWQDAVDRLIEFQARVRRVLMDNRQTSDLHQINRDTAADTIYQIDTLVEPILDEFCRDWSRTTPLVLVAEGVQDGPGPEGIKVYPEGTREEEATIRLIVDPIDGTRGIMYDKRSAWALAGVAPNRGAATRLRDIQAAVMTELPTSKMGSADVLWAIRGKGCQSVRIDLRSDDARPIRFHPSRAVTIEHGFAMVVNFFPGTKVLAGELMEHLARNLVPADARNAAVFDDQYISTGGQFYELIAGHDRFNADLRPNYYEILKRPEGLCCHPYDCATLLVAEEAGVIVTDAWGKALDGPMDVTTGMSWIGYANETLRQAIEPLIQSFLRQRL